MIARAEEVNISLATYGLPHDFDKLRKLSKTSKSEDNDPYSQNFQRLFIDLRRSDCRSVAVLKFWIGYLKDNSYHADLQWLVAETDRLINAL